MDINEVLEMGKQLTVNEEESGKDALKQPLHVGDYVIHLSGGSMYSKLELLPGQVLGFKDGKVLVKKVSERGKSLIYPHKLIKTFGESDAFTNLDKYDDNGNLLSLENEEVE